MKKLIKSMIALALLVGAFLLGHQKGTDDVINNQIVYGSGHTFYAEYKGEVNCYYYEENSTTVQAVVELMMEDWQNVVVKQDDYVVFSGNVQDLHDNEILNAHVQEIANCEDDFAITIFIE